MWTPLVQEAVQQPAHGWIVTYRDHDIRLARCQTIPHLRVIAIDVLEGLLSTKFYNVGLVP